MERISGRYQRLYAVTRRLADVCRTLPSEQGPSRLKKQRVRAMVEWADANGLPLDEQERMEPTELRARLMAMGEFDVSVMDDTT